jgi:integrase
MSVSLPLTSGNTSTTALAAPVEEGTFHSLRHNTTSWLKKAGVPESVVRDIIGHESELVSRQYTHVDDETKRKAIRNLPVLT